MWKVYDKTGTKVRCEVRKVQYSGNFMGECFVNTTLYSEIPIDFEIGDYFIYRNEQFTINYDPSVLKKSGAQKNGEAYVYDGVKFNSFSDELTRCDFLDYVLADNFIHFSALPTFSFFASSIQDLADRIQANLDRIYIGDQKWIVEVHPEYVDTTNVNIDVSKTKVWGALDFIKSKFNANFIIRGRKIIIGTSGIAIDNVFQYGKDKGLFEIQRVVESNQQIITRLRVYGSERNIPVRYYNALKIVDVTISRNGWGANFGYWVQFNIAYTSERFSNITEFSCSGRDIKGTWKHHNQYGEVLEIEHEDYLFINNGNRKNVTRFIVGANLAAFPPEKVLIPDLPNNMAVRNLMLPDFPKITNDPYLDSENISSLGIREGSVFFDGSTDGLEEIYPSMEGMTAQQLIDAGISCSIDLGDNGNLDEIVADATDKEGKPISDDGTWDELKEGANIPPFILTIKDIGFDINDYLTGETATISMKDGMCGGREFEITKCVKQGNKYILTCNRVYDDGLKLYFPYKSYNIKAGDKFVLLNIEMPEVYISAASQRLLKAGKEYLAKNDYVRYTYEVKIDEIFMARHPQLYNVLKEGDLMLFTEPDFHIDGSIIIDSLRITEGEGLIPTYEVTLADDKQVGTIEKIQNVIDSVVSGQGNGGYNAQQINSLIKTYGRKYFLSKIEKDISSEVIDFEKGIELGHFTPGSLGSGGAIKVLPNGQTYVEVDELYVRMKAVFDSLTIKELQSVGGEILLTLASIECTKVEFIGTEQLYDSEGIRLLDSEGNYLLGNENTPPFYRCFFTADDGSKAIINQFAPGDFAQCRQFNVKEGVYEGVSNRYYWRYVVSIGDNYVDLSVDDCAEGSDIPQAGDKIIQLGNRTDVARQNAILLSAYGLTAPTIQMLQGIDSYSLDGKAVKEEGFDQETQQFYSNIYGRSYVGAKDRSSYIEYTPEKGVEMNNGTIKLHLDENNVWEVNKECINIIGDKNGKHIEINPRTRSFDIFDEKNNKVTTLDGSNYTGQDFWGGDMPSLNIINIPMESEGTIRFGVLWWIPLCERMHITNTTTELKYALTADIAITGNETTDCISMLFEILVYPDMTSDTPTNTIVIEEVKKEKNFTGTLTNTESSIILPMGFIEIQCRGNARKSDYSNVNTLKIRRYITSLVTNVYISKYFANGLVLGDSSNNVFSVINEDDSDTLIGQKNRLDIHAYNYYSGIKIIRNGVFLKNNQHWGVMSSTIFNGRVWGSAQVRLDGGKSWNGDFPTMIRESTGTYKFVFPNSWSFLSLTQNKYYLLLTPIATGGSATHLAVYYMEISHFIVTSVSIAKAVYQNADFWIEMKWMN